MGTGASIENGVQFDNLFPVQGMHIFTDRAHILARGIIILPAPPFFLFPTGQLLSELTNILLIYFKNCILQATPSKKYLYRDKAMQQTSVEHNETEFLTNELNNFPTELPMPRLAAHRAYCKLKNLADTIMGNYHEIARKAQTKQRQQVSGLPQNLSETLTLQNIHFT